MSIRLEMLQVARLAPKVLGEATNLIQSFLRQQQNEDGGFKDRSGKSDLYYTVFGLEGMISLDRTSPRAGPEECEAQTAPVFERARSYLERFADGAALDFVHLCCLIRCWASIGTYQQNHPQCSGLSTRPVDLSHLESFRSKDGGFNAAPASGCATAYGAFLGLSAYQDLNVPVPNASGLARSLQDLETSDGAWTNERAVSSTDVSLSKTGSTNATAAACTILRNLHETVRPQAAQWLLARAHPQGGFLAAPNAPLPDLLSTATTLHALAGLRVSIESLKEPCLDFVDSLWTNEGAFYGHWHDDHLDSEYVYYGLLALGHLSL
jgi:prenyltransferase beta subunit